jgi:hypothetical protein
MAWDGQVTATRKSIPGVGSLFEICSGRWTLSKFRRSENLTATLEVKRELSRVVGPYRAITLHIFSAAAILAAPCREAIR